MKLLSSDESLSLRSGCFLFMMLISIFNFLISSDDLFFSSSLIWASVSNKDWSFAICWLMSFNRSWCSSSKLEATCNNLKNFLHNICHYFDASNNPKNWFLKEIFLRFIMHVLKLIWKVVYYKFLFKSWHIGIFKLQFICHFQKGMKHFCRSKDGQVVIFWALESFKLFMATYFCRQR